MKNTKKLVALLGNWRISDSQQHQRLEVRKSRWNHTYFSPFAISKLYTMFFMYTFFKKKYNFKRFFKTITLFICHHKKCT